MMLSTRTSVKDRNRNKKKRAMAALEKKQIEKKDIIAKIILKNKQDINAKRIRKIS